MLTGNAFGSWTKTIPSYWLIDWLHNNDVEINWNGQNVNNNIDFDYANLAIFGFYENSVLDVGPLF